MDRNLSIERKDFLADVAEMYFLEGLTQSEISKKVGVTRSMVSRMLTEARQIGIVKIEIERKITFNSELQTQLVSVFGLEKAIVFTGGSDNPETYLSKLGGVAAEVLKSYLKPGMVLGTAWGTTIGAMINALEIENTIDIKIVQLAGALGGRNFEYDGHSVVRKLLEKLGGEGYFLNVPYIVDKPETVESLMQVQGVIETMDLMKKCDIGIFGVGSTEIDYSTFYSAGYLMAEEMRGLEKYGAIGNVCGLFFDEEGQPTARDFQRRSFTIRKRDLSKIPIRLGIAGGTEKVKAIIGALLGKYINILITDEITASEILRIEQNK